MTEITKGAKIFMTPAAYADLQAREIQDAPVVGTAGVVLGLRDSTPSEQERAAGLRAICGDGVQLALVRFKKFTCAVPAALLIPEPRVRIPESTKPYREPCEKDPCVVCGREVKNPRHYLEVVDGGAYAAVPGSADVNDAGYVGGLPIGPDCLRQHPELKPYVS
jgi:hypothetical protein